MQNFWKHNSKTQNENSEKQFFKIAEALFDETFCGLFRGSVKLNKFLFIYFSF